MPEPPAWMPGPAPESDAGGGPRRGRGEEMVRRILDAGRSTFRRYSYEGARVDDIVEQAGISHGAFYLYFRNKEDLLHRMAVECGARLRVLTADLEGLPRPIALADLRDWVGWFVVAYHDDGPVIRVWLDNRDADPLMQSLANDTLGPLTRALARLVAPDTAARVGDPMAGLSMLSLLERLCSYFTDASHDLVIETATPLLFAATLKPTVTSVP